MSVTSAPASGFARRRRVQELRPDAQLADVMVAARTAHRTDFWAPFLINTGLHWFWDAMHVAIATYGVVLSVVIIA
jgi:hypothetical protein